MRFDIAAFLLLGSLAVAAPVDSEDIEERAFSSPSDPKRFKAYRTIDKLGIICDSDQGPDGETLWYQDLGASIIGYVNYKTEVVKEFPIPWSKGSKRLVNFPQLNNVTGLQCVMRLGKDGNIYGGAGIRNEIIRINPRVDPPDIRTFAPKNGDPAGNLQNFNDAWGGNTELWFSQTTADIVTSFDYKTHVFKDYPVPDANPILLNSPLGMRTDRYDNLWFTNFVGQYLSKVSAPPNRKVTIYGDCCLGLLPLGKGLFPEVLRSATSNLKYLWANSFGGGGYIRMDVTNPNKPAFKYFQNPEGEGTFPFENVNDYCGRIWYTSPVRNNVYYYDPKLDQWTTVVVPPNISGIPVGTGSFEVTMHRGPGPYMWFTEGTTSRIVRYTLDKSCHGEPA